MTTITDYLKDAKQEVLILIENEHMTEEEKLAEVETIFDDVQESIEDLLNRLT